MELSGLHHLGRLGKPWGHRGQLTFQLDQPGTDEVRELGVLFVELDGLRVPFRVIDIQEHPRAGAVVKFADLDDPQSVGFLVNAHVYAPPGFEQLMELDEDEMDPDTLVGMHVIDEAHGPLGMIVRLEGVDGNPLMVVEKEGREILIPLVNEMITGIDLDTGHLVVATPPGLVDLYGEE